MPTLERAPLAQLSARLRIIIIKTGALGDVLRTTALLHPLRRHWPDAKITWITAAAARPLLADNPFIDRLVAMEDAELASVAAEPYDALICLEKEGPQLELAGKIRAEHHAGYLPTPWNTAAIANEEARYMLLLGVSDELKFFHNTKSYPHIITEACGLEFRRDPYILELNPVSRARRDETTQEIARRGRPDLPVIGLNTGCGAVFRTKQWTLEGWAATAAGLVEAGVANVLLMGGPAEAELNAQIARQVPGIIDSGCDNPMEDFFGIIEACDAVVTSDSLGMHIAIARKKYVVALFGSTSHTEIDLYDNGEKVITDFPCSPCYLKLCDKRPTCMQAMSSERVIEALSHGFMDRPVRG